MRNLMKCEIVFSCPRENDAHIRTTSWGFSLGEFTSNVTVINMITYVKYLKQQLGCLVYEGLAVGLDPEGYGNPDFCWISIYDKLIWSFAGPIAIVILVTCSHFLFSHLYIYISKHSFSKLNVEHSCFFFCGCRPFVQMNGGIFMIVTKMSCNTSQKETKKLPVMWVQQHEGQ